METIFRVLAIWLVVGVIIFVGTLLVYLVTNFMYLAECNKRGGVDDEFNEDLNTIVMGGLQEQYLEHGPLLDGYNLNDHVNKAGGWKELVHNTFVGIVLWPSIFVDRWPAIVELRRKTKKLRSESN